MEIPVIILYVLAAVAGIAALELRQSRASVVAVGVAFALVAIAMFVVGAIEVGVGVVVAGAVLCAVLSWGFSRTVQRDELPALPSGATGVLALASVALFAVVFVLAAAPLTGSAPAGGGEAHGGFLGLLREVLVVVAALAAIWAMLRKSGRRDE